MKEDIVLKHEDIYNLNLALTKILDAGLAELVMIINKSGRLITAQSENADLDTISIAALVSGSFASSSSTANLIGEDEFETLFQEGKENHLLVQQIDSNNILTIIFTNTRSNLKRMKLAIEDHRETLLPVLKKLYHDFAADPFLNLDVSGYQSEESLQG